MNDLLRKGFFNNKPKRNVANGRAKSKSTSVTTQFKNQLKEIQRKNLSNSRSAGREDSQSTESNRKIKSTIASSDIKRSQALRNSGESVSIASEKPKAAYFKNTLDSHNKIGSTLKSCNNSYDKYYIDTKNKTLMTPVQNVKLYSNDQSSKGEIEEQLPQMMRFFESDKVKRSPATNVIQYQLDLSEGFIEGHLPKQDNSKDRK